MATVLSTPHRPETVVIEAHAEKIIQKNAKMLTFGGDHFVSLPLIRAHAKKYGPVALLQFDAHCDTWQDDGMSLDHGTMFARAIAEGIIDVQNPHKSVCAPTTIRTWVLKF